MASTSLLRLLAIASAWALSACATPFAPHDQARIDARVHDSLSPVESEGVMTVVDKQSAKERTDKVYSGWIGGCASGVRRFGDETMYPDRIARLEKSLADAFGETALAERTFEVVRYDIHLNGAAKFSEPTSSLAGFEPTYKLSPKCSREKMVAGWFDFRDIEHGNSPMIVDIEVVIDGVTFTSNAAASSVGSPFGGDFSGKLTPFGVDAAYEAMQRAHARLIAEIRRSYFEVEEEQANPPTEAAPQEKRET